VTLALGETADAAVRATVEGLAELLEGRMTSHLEHKSIYGGACGHVDPRDKTLRHFMVQSATWALYTILAGTSSEGVGTRNALREALALTAPYDETAEATIALAKAIRRREVYNVIRRAAVLLEQLDDADDAALLHEYALKHEPAGDGVAFSRIRRRKNELLR